MDQENIGSLVLEQYCPKMRSDKQREYSEKMKDLGPGSYYPKYEQVKPNNRVTYMKKEISASKLDQNELQNKQC